MQARSLPAKLHHLEVHNEVDHERHREGASSIGETKGLVLLAESHVREQLRNVIGRRVCTRNGVDRNGNPAWFLGLAPRRPQLVRLVH